MAERLDFTKAVGRGSRVQVDGFIFLMMSSASRCVMEEKQQRGWAIPGCGSAVGTGRAAELERRERMLSTFSLKKVIYCSCCTFPLWLLSVRESAV